VGTPAAGAVAHGESARRQAVCLWHMKNAIRVGHRLFTFVWLRSRSLSSFPLLRADARVRCGWNYAHREDADILPTVFKFKKPRNIAHTCAFKAPFTVGNLACLAPGLLNHHARAKPHNFFVTCKNGATATALSFESTMSITGVKTTLDAVIARNSIVTIIAATTGLCLETKAMKTTAFYFGGDAGIPIDLDAAIKGIGSGVDLARCNKIQMASTWYTHPDFPKKRVTIVLWPSGAFNAMGIKSEAHGMAVVTALETLLRNYPAIPKGASPSSAAPTESISKQIAKIPMKPGRKRSPQSTRPIPHGMEPPKRPKKKVCVSLNDKATSLDDLWVASSSSSSSNTSE